MSTKSKHKERRSSRQSPDDLRFDFEFQPFRRSLLTWYRKVRRPLPWRTLWQQHHDPYHVWISEIMLQQTVIKAVIPVYARFLERFPNVQSLAAGTDDEVRQAVRGLGYYRRFRFMHEAAKTLVGGTNVWPDTAAGWRLLPGIGDYTAAAITSIAFDKPEAVVDGNVERVFSRLLDYRGVPSLPPVKKVFKKLARSLLDEKSPGDFNQALMELGQTVCTVQSPLCHACPVKPHCLARTHGSQALAPAAKVQPPKEDVFLSLTVFEKGNQFGLFERQQDAKLLKGALGFLTEYHPAPHKKIGVIGSFQHSITKHRIHVDVVRVQLQSSQTRNPRTQGATWVSKHEIEQRLIANLDRKAWRLVERMLKTTSPVPRK